MSERVQPKHKWKLFAWQGVQLEVPRDWSLGAVTGDERKGHFRLDDEEVVRLEARWERGRARTDLEPVVERHIEALRRVAKKQNAPFHAERGIRIGLPPDVDATCFEWRSDYKAYNLLTFCPECKRITLVRVMAKSGERLQPVAARIFGSLRDHGDDSGTPWAVYGLRLTAPESFRLESNALNLKRIELIFRSGAEEAAAARFNLAEMQLRDRPLGQWFVETYEKDLRRYRSLETETEEYRGHAAMRFWARPRSRGLFSLLARPMFLVGRAWSCSQEDKIYMARRLARRDRLEEFDPFCDSVLCHE